MPRRSAATCSVPDAETAGQRRSRRYRPLIAALLALLGFALAAQLRSTAGGERTLQGARQDDLVRILAQTQAREERVRAELARLEALQARLADARTRRAAATDAARERERAVAVLAGTRATGGPGIVLDVADPRHGVRADVLVDAVEELRDAGAEALQLGPVRVGVSSWLLDGPDGVVADGVRLTAPYRITAIGDPRTLAAALAIPGGVQDAVARAGGSATVEQHDRLRVDALRALPAPRYARPAAG